MLVNMSPDFIFTIVYFLLSICFVYPPIEFITAGITIQNLLSGILGNQNEEFILYHIKRSCLNLAFYSMLPLGYVIASSLLGFKDFFGELYTSFPMLSSGFYTFIVILPLLSVYEILNWSRNNFEKHPIAVTLTKFCNNNDWKFVAKSIDTEFRSIEKICLQTSPVVSVIATENWILKVSPLTVNVAHQSDASLTVEEANSYELSPNSETSIQYLNIKVATSRQEVPPFIIRINATDFQDLKDRVARRITILPNVKFHETVMDKFIDVFKENIKNNPLYENNEVLDKCMGCMQVESNIKLFKMCEDSSSSVENKCTNCHCRPMWCCDCMAKWFASRQDSQQVNTWLSSKCSCPMCRATFCILDVCLLSNVNNE